MFLLESFYPSFRQTHLLCICSLQALEKTITIKASIFPWKIQILLKLEFGFDNMIQSKYFQRRKRIDGQTTSPAPNMLLLVVHSLWETSY